MEEIKIGKNDSGQRVDKFLKKFLPKASPGLIYKLIRKKRIKVNNKRVRPSDILKEGDVMQLYLALEGLRSENLVKKALIDFEVIYEDENIVIVNKPAGLLSHSAGGDEKNLVDQIVYYLYKKGEYKPGTEKSFVPALCNRLDRNTGGLVLAAKNFAALKDMNRMIKEKGVDKYYRAIVEGTLKGERQIKGFLTKDERSNKVTVTSFPVKGGREIYTLYRPIRHSSCGYTAVEVQLVTGRPHQIRAHLAYIGHPIVGDYKYGSKDTNYLFRDKYGVRSQLLYAYRLVFRETTPLFEYLKGRVVTAPLPEHFRKIEKDLF